jgi:predicted lipoprotein with Yx(FWY)xxD motif
MVTDPATLGQILTDDKGMTLYAFSDDTSTESMCTGTCAELWPPFLSMGAPTAGDGVDAMLLDTLMLPDGTEQVMYNGHPLYHYSGDMAPGETNGQDLQGKWYVVSPTGDMVEMPTS